VQDYMRDKILGFNAHIIVGKVGGMDKPAEAIEKIMKVPGVTGASPYVEGQAMALGRSRSSGIMVRGIDLDTVHSVMTIGEHVERGSIAELANSEEAEEGEVTLPAIALGRDLALSLGVFYGDEVSLMIPGGVVTPLGMRPKVKRFRVGCIYKFGFWEVDSTVAMVDLPTAKEMFNTDGDVHGIEIKTEDIYRAAEFKNEVKDALGPSYYGSTWFEQQAQLFAALKMEQLLSGLVLSLIMLVAAFNIVSMLLMLVMEKYRDIAILKSMGATDSGIMKIFMTQGTVIGVFGTLIGIIIGLVLCWAQNRYQFLSFDEAVYQFSAVPMKVTLTNVFGVGIGAMLISFLTTIYPSWQAARTKPAESLRYE